jgi:ATP-dependent RNA helicase RhlE
MSDVKLFSDLKLIRPLAMAVANEGYDTPTPIQARAIPHLLEGRDLLGSAQTGTGKTAAFSLPILQGMEKTGGRTRRIRTLVMTPTRELAAQIGESFRTYGKHLPMTSTVIFGGVSQKNQERALQRGPDIVVATPGRLLDLMGQKLISLQHLKYFVLDEADRMLDMGFIHDVRKIIQALPKDRQSLFFSATMPPAVSQLADTMLINPIRVDVAPKTLTADLVDQTMLFVDKDDKRRLLEKLLEDKSIERALVFSRTKHGADRICKQLDARNIPADAIHGNKSQNARTRALDAFRSGKLRVLVATDIAARGIDVDGVSHVINFDLPNEPESYVHRIGRTARAGKEGKAIAFCAGGELEYLQDIERLIKQRVPVDMDHAFHSEDATKGLENGRRAETPSEKQARAQQNRGNSRRGKARSAKGGGPSKNKSKGKGGAPAHGKNHSGAHAKGSAPAKNRRRQPAGRR